MKNNIAVLLSMLMIGLVFTFAPKAKTADVETKHLSNEVKQCFISKLGSTVFEEILSGQREASDNEKQKTVSCFEGVLKENKKIEVKDDVKTCIKKNLGEELSEIKNPTEEQLVKIDSCFKDAQKGAIAFPAETKKCVVSIAGVARAEKLMGGEAPTLDEKMKIGPKCFGMKPPKDAEMENMSDETKQCIQNVLGGLMSEPTEDQKREIGQRCFGGEMMDKAKSKMRQMNNEEKNCLQNLFGKSPEEMGPLTADQEKLAGERCFSQSQNQNQEQPSSSGFSDSQKSCIHGILGRDISNMDETSDEEKRKIGQCFGQLSPNNNQGQEQNPNQFQGQSETPGGIASLKEETKSCIATKLGLTVATLNNANYNDPAVESVVATCKTANGE